MNSGDIRKSDSRFADVTIDTTDNMEDIDEYFELQNFGLTVDKMNSRRTVERLKTLRGNKIAVLFKKIIRKLVKFYIEPIVRNRISLIFTRPQRWHSFMQSWKRKLRCNQQLWESACKN